MFHFPYDAEYRGLRKESNLVGKTTPSFIAMAFRIIHNIIAFIPIRVVVVVKGHIQPCNKLTIPPIKYNMQRISSVLH